MYPFWGCRGEAVPRGGQRAYGKSLYLLLNVTLDLKLIYEIESIRKQN